MDLKLGGHVALVQGASRGLGRGIAEALAREGCDLLITARHEPDLASAAAAITAETGRRVVVQTADSANLADNEALIERARKEFDRLDIVVSNSGGPPPGGFRDLTTEQWRAANDLLIVSPSHMVKCALPLLRKSPAPRFFIITSSSTRVPVPGLTLSNVFRPALTGLIKVLTEELAGDKVRVHSIAPGRFATERLSKVITAQATKAGKTEGQIRAEMLGTIPAGRFGDPKDLGALVAFLSSPLADYINGQNLLVDGGLIRAI